MPLICISQTKSGLHVDEKLDIIYTKAMRSTDPLKKNSYAQKMVDHAQSQNLKFEILASTHISLAWKQFYEEVEETPSERLYPMVSRKD